MTLDIREILYDPRPVAPEADWDYSPSAEAQRAYYEGGEGHPCPVCQAPKPEFSTAASGTFGCWFCGPETISYKKSSWDYEQDNPFGRNDY